MRMENTLATATERLERTRSIYNELQAQVTDPCVARFKTIYHGRECIFGHGGFTGTTHLCASREFSKII